MRSKVEPKAYHGIGCIHVARECLPLLRVKRLPQLATREEHHDNSKQTIGTPPTWHGNDSLRKSTAVVVHPIHNATDYSCLMEYNASSRQGQIGLPRSLRAGQSTSLSSPSRASLSSSRFIQLVHEINNYCHTPHYRTPNHDRLGSGLNGIEGTQKSYRLQV